jgi:hypothetical protein
MVRTANGRREFFEETTMGNNAARVSATWIGGRWVDSPAAVRERLGELVTRIRSMKGELLAQERIAFDLCEPNAIERAAFTRASIEIAKDALVGEVETMLAACPLHAAGALVSGCPDCVAAADRCGGPAVPSEIRLATRRR